MKLLLCGNLHFSVASWSSIYPRMRFNSPHRSAFDSNIEELCQCWPFVNSMWWLTCIQGSIQPVLSQPKLNCSFSGPVNARVPLFYMRCPPNRWRSVQFFIHELTFLLFQFVKKGEKVSHMVLFFFLFFFFFSTDTTVKQWEISWTRSVHGTPWQQYMFNGSQAKERGWSCVVQRQCANFSLLQNVTLCYVAT